MWKSIISTLALASLASVPLLYSAGPADAKKNICVRKAQQCEGRCMARGVNFANCVERTCNKQYNNCMQG